ncbi:hypothetical protein FRC20_002172 [Serendipita sp. 405]|nr:hypothetical protein FRC20_002172 [Serendipita sp. 405]
MNASRAIREKAAKLNGSSQTPRTVVTTREKGKGEMAPPSATPKRTANDLTPAARALLARSTTKSTAGMTPVHHTSSSGSIFSARPGTGSTYERDLRKVKWTPSPMTRR